MLSNNEAAARPPVRLPRDRCRVITREPDGHEHIFSPEREYSTYRTYNPDGSVRLMWAPAVGGLPEETLWYRYNGAGDPEWVSGDRTYVADTIYSPFGEVEQFSLGVNPGRENWQTFTYEEGTRRLLRMRVDRVGINPADVNAAYSYDPAGNPVRIADTGGKAAPGDVQCFTDHHRRLVGAWAQSSGACASGPGSASLGGSAAYGQSYGYDLAGNRTQLVEHGVGGGGATTSTYGYPAAGQARPHSLTGVTASGPGGVASTTFGYDGGGNTTTMSGPDGTTGYTWDAESRLGSANLDGGTSEFVYDADGARLIRREPDATTLYVFGTEVRLGHATQTVTGTRYYTFNGQVLAMRQGATNIYTLGADLWGTPTSVIDNVAHTTTVRRQDPFGNPRGTQPVSWPGDRGFHTGTGDPATGLVQMGARSYHPTSSRFLSVDPLIDPGD